MRDHEMFAPIFDPLYRAAEDQRRNCDANVFRIEDQFWLLHPVRRHVLGPRRVKNIAKNPNRIWKQIPHQADDAWNTRYPARVALAYISRRARAAGSIADRKI
jgi:hypothetical protein